MPNSQEEITVEEKVAALEMRVQKQQEVIDKMNVCVKEFTRMLRNFSQVCSYEISLHEKGLKP